MFLEVKGLNTYYGATQVLKNVSLTVDEGEVVSLLGRNGMGKSTTLKSIMGIKSPKSGQILFKDKDIAGFPPYKVARAGVAYVPEERRIFPNLTVYDNLVIGIKHGRAQKKNPANGWTVEKIFDQFPEIARRSEQKGGSLSGGEQQMLAIGRSLMGNPELLMVDEPTEGLSPILVQEVRDMLVQIKEEGVSILLVEHNIKMALSVSDRVYLMAKAYLAFEGTVKELEAHPEIKAKYLEI